MQCSMILPKAEAKFGYKCGPPAIAELASLYDLYTCFNQRAMTLIPPDVWRRRSYFEMNDMTEVGPASNQGAVVQLLFEFVHRRIDALVHCP